MAPLNSSATSNNTLSSSNVELIYGFVHQPNGRGTLDIIISCTITFFLCSWSVLCLNIPSQDISRWAFLRQKFRWMIFTILFPEVITALAAEQWESANQTVEEFSNRGFTRWTMRQAFFADMGGFMLKCPDFPAFPIDGQQLVYLVDQKYIEFPEYVSERMIWDKNKADGFARAMTITQIGWFCIQCIGRGIQHLALSTIELSTLAFIWCSINTFFFWYHKPLDAETSIVLQTNVTMAQILVAAGDAAKNPYSRTPLDFLKGSPSRYSLIAPFWFGLGVIHDFRAEPPPRPITSFGNTRTLPHRGLTPGEHIFGHLFTLTYFGIHLVGWNFHFPTHAEQLLWRGASLLLLALLILYLVAIAAGTIVADRFASFFFQREVETVLDTAALLPKWLQIVIHVPVIAAYVVARSYVIVEGFVSLRALPRSCYESVNWSNFFPHV